MWKICWEAKIEHLVLGIPQKAHGCGEAVFEKDAAEIIAKNYNEMSPDFKHWAEEG